MRILVLAPQPFFAERGTPIAVRALVEVLAAEGHEVDLLTYHEGENVDLGDARHVRSPGGPGLREIPPGFSLKKLVADVPFFFRALGLVLRHDYDLVHAVEESAFMALLFRWVVGTPYVYDMDSSLPEQLASGLRLPEPVTRLLESAEAVAIRGSDAVLTVCEELEVRATRAAGPERMVGRIEDFSLLGSEEDPEVEDLDESIGATGPIVLYVGNLQPYQGVDLLIDAFPRALERVGDAQLVVIGGGPGELERYRQRAAAQGIGGQVHLVGPRPLDHLGAYLRQATILASPRISGTNTPMKIYSYLDSGVPIVATRLTTHTQVLNDEIAVLAPPRPDPFGRALGRLLADPELRGEIADRAAEVAEREYSREAFDRKIRSFYRRVERLAGEG